MQVTMYSFLAAVGNVVANCGSLRVGGLHAPADARSVSGNDADAVVLRRQNETGQERARIAGDLRRRTVR